MRCGNLISATAGVAIGAVFASEKYVCPNAVGVDIGCGMCAVPIEGLYKDDLSDEDLHRLQSLIKARIPTSFDSHDAQLPWAKETLKDITSSLALNVAAEEKTHRTDTVDTVTGQN